MLGIILLVMGLVYFMRRPKIARMSPEEYPQVPRTAFEEWQQNELRSIDVFLAATWGTMVVGFLAGLIVGVVLGDQRGPAGASVIALLFFGQLALFLFGLITSAIYGSRGAKLRKDYNIQLPK
jgi:hypothetical protein